MYIAQCGKSSIFQSFKFFVKTCLFSFFQIKQHPKSKSTMYLNEDHLRPPSNHQGNIVRFLRSLVVSKSKIHNHKSRVFGKDLKQHLAETRNESKIFKIFFSQLFKYLLTQPSNYSSANFESVFQVY